MGAPTVRNLSFSLIILAVNGHNCGYYWSAKVKTSFYVTDGNIMYLTDASRFLTSCMIQHYAPVVGWWGGGGGTDA